MLFKYSIARLRIAWDGYCRPGRTGPTTDDGQLIVIFNNNHFLDISECAPRVRFGEIHVYNNLYEGKSTDAVYPRRYSIGVGYKAKIIAQNNAFHIADARSFPDIAKPPPARPARLERSRTPAQAPRRNKMCRLFLRGALVLNALR